MGARLGGWASTARAGLPQAPTPVKRTRALGEILVDDGFISQEQLDDARRDSEQSGKSLGRTLIDITFLPKWAEAAFLRAGEHQTVGRPPRGGAAG